jgi:peptide/nickel transport system substrate-binding protein
MRLWRLPSVVAMIVAAGLVVSCGAAPGRDAGAGAPPLAAVNPYGGDPAAEGPPQRGGTLVMGGTAEATSFDPTVLNGNSAASAVYDSLMRMTPDGGVEPYLARSMDSQDGGRTWLLRLRPGVRFHDGTDLDANAVIVNVQRHIDTPTSPGHGGAMMIRSMRAVDPLTVEFALTEPVSEFSMLFALSFTEGALGMIVSPAALQRYGDDIGNHPVGAGPFELVEWVRDSRTVLVRNDDYWQPDLPYLDGLEFRPLPDTESRYASVQNGDVDLIFAGYNQELVRALDDPNLEVYYGPGDGGEFLRFNFAKPPFDDHRMREAVIRALDMNALAVSQYNGRLVPARSLFGDDSPYHTQAASGAWPTYDPQRARQLVDEYRAGGGNPDFTFTTSTSRVQFAEFVQAQMAAVGITIDLEFYDLAEFTSTVTQSGNFQLTTWVGEVNTAYPGVGRLLGTGGSANHGEYSNPEVDRLLDVARVSSDPAERARAYQRIELLSGQDLAVAWFSRTYRSTIARREVNGVDRYALGTMWFSTAWLAPH